MTIAFVLASVAVLGWLLWRPLDRARWRRAERSVAQRLPLGSGAVIRGAEPINLGSAPRAVLLLHGFGDTPQSLGYLAERLAEAGWTVSVPLLPGHGRTLAAFQASRAEEWVRHAQAAFDDLAARHDGVAVCGQSMGATLALELAATRRVRALALLAPYLSMPTSARVAALAWPALRIVLPVLRTHGERSIHDPDAGARSLAYGYTTPRLLAELATMVRRARRRLRDVRMPTLIVHSREDNRVDAHAVERAAAHMRYSVAAVRWMSGCGHVLTADYCKDAVAAQVLDWFERMTAAQDAAPAAR